jgi:glutamate-ammonia-ligase adenylyltransferase
VIAAVLATPRPDRDIAADAATMRAEMAVHKPPMGAFDAKLVPGGLVDLEFTVHVAQLLHARGFVPDLRIAIERLAARGLVPTALMAAHDLLTRLLVAMRLVAPDANDPSPATEALIAHALKLDDWAAVVAAFAATRQDVQAAWRQTIGPS